MRTALNIVLFSWCLLAPCNAMEARFRTQKKAKEYSNTTLVASNGQSRSLPDDGDNGDVSLLNRLIALLIPVINDALAQIVPDPLNLDLIGSIDTGSLQVGDCTFSSDLDYNWGGMCSSPFQSLFSQSSYIVSCLSVWFDNHRHYGLVEHLY